MKNERAFEISNCVSILPAKSSRNALFGVGCLFGYIRKLAKHKAFSIENNNSHIYGFLGTMDFLDRLS